MSRKRDSKYDDAYQLYLDGMSLEQVANSICVTRQCVYKAFKKRNFILRSPNFQPHQYFDGHKFTLRNHGYYEKTTGKSRIQPRPAITLDFRVFNICRINCLGFWV